MTQTSGPRVRGTIPRARSGAPDTTAPADQPAGSGQPRHLVNVTYANAFRYSTGDDGYDRAVYEQRRTSDGGDKYWQHRAALPHVHARIVRRDGGGRRIGTEYLISGTADGPRVLVTDDDLSTGVWAMRVGVDLSSDRQIITAAGTALRHMAHRYATEREATPRADVFTPTGHLDLAVPECLPDGYLRTPPGSTEASIRAAWAELAPLIAANPRMALAFGASVAAPYVGPLNRQSFWVSLSGEQRQGKTTTHAVCAAVWGQPVKGGVVISWDLTQIGLSRHLGQLGIMPAFLDERGIAKFTPHEFGELIYRVTDGGRITGENHTPNGTRRALPWRGVVVESGNGRFIEGCETGRFVGVPARVVELSTPFTRTAAEADLIYREVRADDGDTYAAGLVHQCYGWLGPQVLARYTAPQVRGLVHRAADTIGQPDGGTGRTIAEHLHLAVAGATMADTILGTGHALADAATEAARDHLAEHSHDPAHDADRMLAAIAEAMFARRPAWPAEGEWVELGRPRPDHGPGTPPRSELAQHGYDHETAGILSADGQWVYVFPAEWRRLCESTGCDSTMALRELFARKALHVAPGARSKGEWTDRPKIDGVKAPGIYKIRRAAIEPDDTEATTPDTTPPAPTPPAPTPPAPTPPASSASSAADDTPAVCATCGQPLLLRRPGRDRCARCDTDAAVAAAAKTAAAVHRAEAARAATPEPATRPAVEHAAAPAAAPAPTDQPEAQRPAQRRGAHPAAASRTEQRKARLAADLARLDAGQSVRVLAALEGEFAPMRRGVDGRMHRPYFAPELPGMIGAAHIVTGYHWRRPYVGEVVVLDRSGAWVAAASSADVAHGALEHTGPLDAFEGRPGYYRVDVHPWHEADTMPHPLGHPGRAEAVWVPAPTVALLRDLAEQGRWADASILDSYTGDPARLTEWTRYVNTLRGHAIDTYGRDSDQYAEVKVAVGQAMSLMLGTDDPGHGRTWRCLAQRPDWTHTWQAQAAATLWRWADDCRILVPDHGPVMLRNVDELLIPTPALEVVTTTPRRGGRRPMLVDPAGKQLGSFKVKGTEAWTGAQA